MPVTPEQAAAEAKTTVLGIGEAFSRDHATLRRARQIGLTGWSFYVAGRGGVLGDVRAETVAAALGFIAPSAVNDGWEGGRRVASPAEIAAYHLAECCRWGRDRLERFAEVPRLVDLAERVAISALPAGMPLFAAARAMPVPDDSVGARAAVVLHLLREHREAARLMAVRVCGLTPIEALVVAPSGEAGARGLGWTPPFPAPEPLIRRGVWAEVLTDRMVGEAFRALEPTEREELVRLLDEVAGAVLAED